MLKSFIRWFREQWTYAGIINAHRSMGNPSPRHAANQEIFLRSHYLEPFRDFASDRYMQGHDLASSADLFIKKRLAAKTTALDAAQTATIRAVIRDMKEDEAFHPEVLAKFRSDMQRGIDEAVAQSKRIYGQAGRSKYVDRVLHGRA